MNAISVPMVVAPCNIRHPPYSMTAARDTASTVPGSAPDKNEAICICSIAVTKARFRVANRLASCASPPNATTTRMPITVSTRKLPRSAPRSRMARVIATNRRCNTTNSPVASGTSTVPTTNSRPSSQIINTSDPIRNSTLPVTANNVSPAARCTSLTSLLIRLIRSPSRNRA